MGFSAEGFEHALVVERNPQCLVTLRHNQAYGGEKVRHWPLAHQDVRELSYCGLDRVDVVTGGPPCQPFSFGGKGLAYDDARDMFPEAVRAVRNLRPKAFVFENVKGLTRSAFAEYLDHIKLQLAHPWLIAKADESWRDHRSRILEHERSGGLASERYDVAIKVVDAADYGVPQRRHRTIFVGFRADLGIEWAFPKPTHSQEALLWDQFSTGSYWGEHSVRREDGAFAASNAARAARLREAPTLLRWRTVRDAIGDLPDPEYDPGAAKVPNHRFQAGARAYVGHTGSLLDEPAKALKAGVHGVPGGENMLARADGSVRYFTVREAARVQTFSDDFVFPDLAWSESMRQLGNAVPVRLASVIARAVRQAL